MPILNKPSRHQRTPGRPARRRGRWLRRLVWILLFIVLLLAAGAGSVEAADGMRGNNCVIENDEVIAYDFYFLCNNLTIRGTVNGDLIGVASKVVVVRGSVINGDIWVGGGQLVIEGDVRDDIHFGGGKLQLTKDAILDSPQIDVAAAAISVNINRDAYLPGDLLMLGYQAIIEGTVGANVDFQGQTLIIDGTIGGNVDAIVGDRQAESPLGTLPLPFDIDLESPGFVIRQNTTIEGNLSYEAPQQVVLQRNTVGGSISYKQSLRQADITRVEQSETFLSIMRDYLINVTQDTVSLMIVGLFALQFVPILMTEPGKRVQRAYLPAVSWGFMMFILSFPMALILIIISILIVLILTLVTLSGMTFAATLFFIVVNVVVIGGFWFFLVFVGPAITCFVIGTAMIRLFRRYTKYRQQRNPDDPPLFVPPLQRRYRWIGLAIGVLTVSLLINLPLPSSLNPLKLLLQGAVAFTGLGALFMYGRDVWHMGREEWLVGDMGEDRLAMVPADQDVTLGLDNLPGDFDGFFE